MSRKIAILSIGAIALPLWVAAQETDANKGRFSALLRMGLCTSQIHNDDYGGYNKLGLTGGIGTFTPVGKNLNLQLELNYAMRGSRKRPTRTDPTTYKIEAHYIDIPILLKTHISFFELEAGLLNGIFLFHTEADGAGRIRPGFMVWEFNRYELAANLGINIPMGEKWLANARFHYSILPASGRLGFVNGLALYGGAYNNVVTLSLHRLLKPKG